MSDQLSGLRVIATNLDGNSKGPGVPSSFLRISDLLVKARLQLVHELGSVAEVFNDNKLNRRDKELGGVRGTGFSLE